MHVCLHCAQACPNPQHPPTAPRPTPTARAQVVLGGAAATSRRARWVFFVAPEDTVNTAEARYTYACLPYVVESALEDAPDERQRVLGGPWTKVGGPCRGGNSTATAGRHMKPRTR